MSLFVALPRAKEDETLHVSVTKVSSRFPTNSRGMCWLRQMKTFHEILKPRLGAQ
jgi:hypothetical protein